MASLESLQENMRKIQIPEEIMAQLNFNILEGETYNSTVRNLLIKMEKLLTKEQQFSLMEQEGCCKDGSKQDSDCKNFAKENADKPLTEKLALLSSVENMMAPCLNEDGTITISWGGYQNGVHTGKTTCSCPHIMREVKNTETVPVLYCGCCAGHFLYHLQNAFNIKLRLKEINSSPLNTNGEKPCSMTFEIVG